ncbi:MAG TPA: sigma-70 family RNA polymerase sigma factor [Lacipirellulaceae bacterium]|nr:sigma-70 family RNA polymerase sigma factor [Lacipirellulaceae bacterium]
MSGCELSDAELMAAVRRGDRAAFDALFRRYWGEVFALCQRILQSRTDAEDAGADVFCEVWRRRERYDPSRAAPRTYLMTLSRSRAIDRLRSRAARPDMTPRRPPASSEAVPASEPAPDESAAARELRSRVVAALADLTPQQRQAMELAYFEGLSHRQIADRLDAPLGTIKTYIRQGVGRLRVAMGARPSGAD